MSDLRVAWVAEGPTDAVIVEAALKALLPRPFVLTQLQPEETRPKLGTGWGGVLRWCLDFAGGSYQDVSPELACLAIQRGWLALPNALPCPPCTPSADAMRACVMSWSGLSALGPRTVLCVPSKSIDAWLAAAACDHSDPLSPTWSAIPMWRHGSRRRPRENASGRPSAITSPTRGGSRTLGPSCASGARKQSDSRSTSGPRLLPR
jgi:hypothetical protein